MNSERKIRTGKARNVARWVASAAFAIVASLVAGAPDASAQASGWHETFGVNEMGPHVGLSWNGYGYVTGYQWPPTPECDCDTMCAGYDPNDPSQACPCDPMMCVQDPWQTMGPSPVQWFAYTPYNPTAATYPPPAHTISVTGMQIRGLQAQSAATANDPDGYIIASAGGPAENLAMGATHIFTPPVSNLTLSGHDPGNFMIRFGLLFTAPTGPSAEVTVTPVFNPPNYPPVAEAGPDQTGNGQFTVDGSASYDPGGEIVSYFWTQESPLPPGPQALIQSQSDAAPTIIATNPAGISGSTVYTFKLTVMDGSGALHTDTVTITVNNMVTPVGDPVLTVFDDPSIPDDPLFDAAKSFVPGGKSVAPALRQPRLQPAPRPVQRKK